MAPKWFDLWTTWAGRRTQVVVVQIQSKLVFEGRAYFIILVRRKKRCRLLFLVTLPSAGVRSIAMSVCVCMSVCPLALCQRPHVQTSRNFLHMLPVAVAWSFSDDNSTCTSGFVHDVMFAHNGPHGAIGRILKMTHQRAAPRVKYAVSTTAMLVEMKLQINYTVLNSTKI